MKLKNILDMNKKGAFTDLFLFMIIAFVLIVVCVIFVYIGVTVYDALETQIAKTNLVGDGNNNATVVLENTFGRVNTSLNALKWIAILLIFGMILGIFVGSYMVTTKPVFFIPFIIIIIIAVIVAVGISNAYEQLYANATLNPTFNEFIGVNWIMAQLPIIISIIGFAGAIIMFVRMGKREEVYYGY